MLKFNTDELEDIRDALYNRVESLKENMGTLVSVQEGLANGRAIPPFAPGEAGIRATKGMVASMEVRKDRIERLIERVSTELDAEDDEDEDDSEDSQLDASDIPEDFPVRPLRSADAANAATCGTCGLSWDDSISTQYTPTPSGRCPFEYFHSS